jgi:hypothetical protein
MKTFLFFLLIILSISAFDLSLNPKKSIQRASEHISNIDFQKIVGKFGDIKLHR